MLQQIWRDDLCNACSQWFFGYFTEVSSLRLATWDTEKLERFIEVMNTFLEMSKLSEKEILERLKRSNIEASKEASKAGSEQLNRTLS